MDKGLDVLQNLELESEGHLDWLPLRDPQGFTLHSVALGPDDFEVGPPLQDG